MTDKSRISPNVHPRIELADHDEISRMVADQPQAIKAAIITICAHCTVLTDDLKCSLGSAMIADLAGAISQNCLALAEALHVVAQSASPEPNLFDISAVKQVLQDAHSFISTTLVDDINPAISKKAIMQRIESALSRPLRDDIEKCFEPTFHIDKFGWVTATQPDGGKLRTQSVEAHLLYAILQRLEGGGADVGKSR